VGESDNSGGLDYFENHGYVLFAETERGTVSKLTSRREMPVHRILIELRFHDDDDNDDDRGHVEERKGQKNTVEKSPAPNDTEVCRTAIVDLMLPFS